MDRTISKINTGRYCSRVTSAVIGVLSVVAAAVAVGSIGVEFVGKYGPGKKPAAKHLDVMDIVNEQRVRFAADHGVANPIALAAAVRHSPMANLLISVAIEESRGDPVAVGSSGEQGAWQVIASNWGTVPKDLHGQAGQAERIIQGLLIYAKGNEKKALAHYNGGTIPPRKSYRYAERILKRAGHLQIAATYLSPNYKLLRQALLDVSGPSRLFL
jgi:hypothetical protein